MPTTERSEFKQLQHESETYKNLVKRLHPNRMKTSPKMNAITAFMLNCVWTHPYLAEIVVTSDGFVMGRRHDDCGCNEFIGAYEDLERNWIGLLDAAGVIGEERIMADDMFRKKVRRC